MAREFFQAYHSFLEAMEPLNDAECGRLFKACLIYSMSGEVPELRGNERFVFPSMKGQIDRDLQNYEKKCSAGSAGAKSKWGESNNHLKRSERLKAARAIASHTSQEWEEMLEFFAHSCVKCGDSESKIVKDHIIPIYQGGSDGIDNLQPLCLSCNSAKGPENIDHRLPRAEKMGIEMPGKWLATPSKPLATPKMPAKEKEKEKENSSSSSAGARAGDVEIIQATPGDNDLAKVSQAYQANIGMISQMIGEELAVYSDRLGAGMVLRAIKEACDNNKKSWGYVRAILDSKEAAGINTLAQWDAAEIERKNAAQSPRRSGKAPAPPNANPFL